MAELMEHVQVLADEIGPRPVSTEEEHQASMYVAENLQAEGLEVDVEEFTTPTGVRWPYAVSFAMAIAGTLLSGLGTFAPAFSTMFFALGLLFMAAGLVIYFTERLNRPILSKMLSRGVSQNVVARYVPSSVARERRRRKIIFVAHLDTGRAQPEAMPSVVNALPVLKTVLYYVMIAVAALMVVRMLPLPWPDTIDFALWVVGLVGCVYLLAALVCIVANRFMPYVTGANNNASAIAVLLGLAHRLLDPAERERYAKDDGEEGDGDEEGSAGLTAGFAPVETFTPETGTGTFAAVAATQVMPAIHGEDAAVEAGVVPEGAQIEYASETAAAAGIAETAVSAAETTVMPAIKLNDAEEPVEEPEPAEPEVKAEEAGMPSWYIAAKRKAATSEPEPVAEDGEEFRSLYAAIPTTRQAAREMFEQEQGEQEQEAEQESAVSAEDQEMVDAMQSRSVNDILEELGVDPADAPAAQAEEVNDQAAAEKQASPVSAVARVAAPALAAAKAAEKPAEFVDETIEDPAFSAAMPPVESDEEKIISMAAFKGELAVTDVDDLEPSLTGSFRADDVVSSLGHGLGDLKGRIPSIGQSDDNEEAANAFSTFAAVDAGDAAPFDASDFGEDAADDPDDAKPEQATGLAAGLTGSFRALKERRAAAKEARAAQPKYNAKPTARRVSADFEPTQTRNARDEAIDMLSQSRQKAAVSSTFEDTIQSAPKQTQAFDPFAPKGSPAADASLISPSASTSFPAIEFDPIPEPTNAAPASMPATPAGTSTFPSLTSSFPSLSENLDESSFFSSTNADDFDETSYEAFNGFAPKMDAQIDMPSSRLHNAMDKVGGLFSKFGKKNKNEDLGFDDGWNEDESGWKGGAYFDSDLASDSRAAIRERAAQIRESVVSMTENDLLDKEVWFVALGASGAGNRGMKNFLELHKSDLRGALIVNLEGVGSGDICFVDYEGNAKPHRSDRRLQSLVRKASKDFDGVEMRAERIDYRDTDATPAMEAGVRAMTIMGFDGVAPTGWHWTTDYTGIVEEEKLEYVTSVLLKMVENS